MTPSRSIRSARPIGRSVGPVLLQDLQPHAVVGVEDAPS